MLQLADTLLDLKKRGLTYKGLATVLEQREIKIYPAAIARYLSEVAPKKSKPTAKRKPKSVAKSKESKFPEMMPPKPYSSPLVSNNPEPKKQKPLFNNHPNLENLV